MPQRRLPPIQVAVLAVLEKHVTKCSSEEEVRQLMTKDQVCALIAETIREHSEDARRIWRTAEQEKEHEDIILRYLMSYTFPRPYSSRCHISLMVDLANDIRQLLGVKKTRTSYKVRKGKKRKRVPDPLEQMIDKEIECSPDNFLPLDMAVGDTLYDLM